MTEPYLSPDITATIQQAVTDATWLERRGHHDLAIALRTEFCAEWGFEADHWNDEVDTLIDYVQRKGETPEISTRQLMAVRFQGVHNDAA